MRKTVTALLAATTLAVAAVPTSAEARWGWGWGWGGFGLGLATGAIIGGALARPVLRLWVRLRLPSLLFGLLPEILPQLLRLLWSPLLRRVLSVLAHFYWRSW